MDAVIKLDSKYDTTNPRFSVQKSKLDCPLFSCEPDTDIVITTTSSTLASTSTTTTTLFFLLVEE